MLLRGHSFPRGKGPLISVLIPTRGRPTGLIRAMRSCHLECLNSENIEFVLKVDEDDTPTIDLIQKMKEENFCSPIRVLCSSRSKGYSDTHIRYNQLAEMSTGDWLFIFNDDAAMYTQGWDDIIKWCGLAPGEVTGWEDGIFMLIPQVINHPNSHEFFFVRREVFKTLGHLSPTPCVDSYLSSVMILVQRYSYISIDIHHQKGVGADPTEQQRALVQLCSPVILNKKLEDASKLIQRMVPLYDWSCLETK